jgi:hypothetical protein
VTADLAGARRFAAKLPLTLVAVTALLATAGLHLAAQGRAALAACEVALGQNDGMAAAAHARNAARAHVPGFSYAGRAYQRLREIAEMSERKGDVESALFAWRAMTSATAGSRPFGTPCEDDCQRAEASVARLTAAVVRASARTSAGRRHAANLENPPAAPLGLPGVASSVLVVVGAALTWAAAVRMARVFNLETPLRAAPARAAAGWALAGLVVWVAGVFVG